MESVVGTWKYDPNNTKGLDEFIAAVDRPPIEPLFRKSCTMKVTLDGNTFSSTTTWEDGSSQTTQGQLGQPVVVDIPGIGKSESISHFDGTYFITTSTFDGVKMSSKSRAEGKILTMESTANGKTVISRLTKV